MALLLDVGAVVAGKYRLEREIGSGGMGVVYAATNIHLEQRVALKFLHVDTQTPETIERFWREARSAAKIQSEHVARVLDIGELDNTPYIVMEYLEGDDLENIVKSCGPLPVSDAIRYLLEACEALAEVHALGMVHRDIKPANLFLASRADGTSTVKLLDFGISKSSWDGDSKNSRLTQTSTVIGSPHYMSPEQLRSSRDVDARSDVWALGVTLFELLGGDSPFASGTMPEVCASILKDEPISLVGLRPEVPVELEQVIDRCLEKKVTARWATIAEFAAALEPFGLRGATQRSIARITGVLHKAAHTSSMGSIPPPLKSKARTLDQPLGIGLPLIPSRIEARPALAPTDLSISVPRTATEVDEVRSDDVLEADYLTQIGDTNYVPHRVVDLAKLSSISSLDLDHRAGFLISMMDGQSSLEDLLSISGMSRLETLRLIVALLGHRVIRLAPPLS